MHTEDQARQKWCPFASTAALPDSHPQGGTIYDTRGQSTGFTACIASACMAWQWDDGQQNDFGADRPEGEGWKKVGSFWCRNPKPGDAWRPGYCGLAVQS